MLIEIIIDDTLFVIGIIATLIVIIILLVASSRQKNKAHLLELDNVKKEGILNDKETELQKVLAEMRVQGQDYGNKLFEEWKGRELETHRKVIIEAAYNQAQAMLAEWKLEAGDALRKDAVKRSMGVNFGKITEHLIPFSIHLQDFDPRDIRFIGSPVDLMIFDGATEKRDIINIYLVEIKTGTGQLSKKQKTIRTAIEENRVFWKPIVVPEFKWDVQDDNEETSEDPFSPAY